MELIAVNVLSVLAALPQLIKLIRELMKQLQEQMGKGMGKEKKEAVLTIVSGVIGDESIWEKVVGIFSWIIDCIALFKTKDTEEVK